MMKRLPCVPQWKEEVLSPHIFRSGTMLCPSAWPCWKRETGEEKQEDQIQSYSKPNVSAGARSVLALEQIPVWNSGWHAGHSTASDTEDSRLAWLCLQWLWLVGAGRLGWLGSEGCGKRGFWTRKVRSGPKRGWDWGSFLVQWGAFPLKKVLFTFLKKKQPLSQAERKCNTGGPRKVSRVCQVRRHTYCGQLSKSFHLGRSLAICFWEGAGDASASVAISHSQ